jgi:hypothetical protein
MIPKSERGEALAISTRLMKQLMNFSITSDQAGADFRSAIGTYLSNFYDNLTTNVLGEELYNCFEMARAAGATLTLMNTVREAMLLETPMFPLGLRIVNAAIIFSFVEQSQIISVTVFTSRIQVDDLMDQMGTIIEEIKLNKADSFVSNDYQNFVTLSSLLIQHLSATERQLPRVIAYTFSVSYPALTMSNRIYGDGTRSDELAAENKTVHPAFMQRDIIALSQ